MVSCLEFAHRCAEDLRLRASMKPSFRLGMAEQAANTTARRNYGRCSENALKRAAERLDIKATVIPDEAAFYGPKIDMKLLDALGRKWQLSTVQFDLTSAARDSDWSTSPRTASGISR